MDQVRFASGGYDRDDPTPEHCRAIQEAAERAERARVDEHDRHVWEANADLLALCRGEGAG